MTNDEGLICHVLIGCPASGKSTLAGELAKLGNYQIVSTDAIRQTLYGDATIQGEWLEIEQSLLQQIQRAIASGQPIIYDATNAKRSWRMSLLMQLHRCSPSPPSSPSPSSPSSSPFPLWIGWHLKTPLSTCLYWNKQRSRQVPDSVIESLYQSLHQFPPLAAEGFAGVYPVTPVKGKFDIGQIQTKLQRLRHSQVNRTNRTQHGQIQLHRYSRLLDFDRLLHLISLILAYPGIGNLQQIAPQCLKSLLGSVPEFATFVEEICAVMAKCKGSIYAVPDAIADDLHWLTENGLIGYPIRDRPIQVEPYLGTISATHPYSDWEPFQRLLATIRFILHHPFLENTGGGNLPTLVEALKTEGILVGDAVDTVRKDIEKILKPYQLLPNTPMRQGYFLGTALLWRHELKQVFAILQSQAQSFDDPVALETYELFRDRITSSKLDITEVYPVRAIAHQSMVDIDSLPSSVLARNLDKLEDAIASGKLLELNRHRGGGRFPGDQEGFFTAWCLQIVFYHHAWYVAFEQEEKGKGGNLFRFERLDRLFIGQPQSITRSRQAQVRSLNKLQRLHQASAGLFLGNRNQEGLETKPLREPIPTGWEN
ncbi:MAG: ATP-binding protein [Coleofasciculus chthonoplastes F3-SA18-01]|uniref:AAA family ATPase n=1 Tax=Coleofasciculus chthonoplastes TaxID=64178 RepID=UPI0032FD19B9